MCLAPEDNHRLISAPPPDPQSFTNEVFVVEGFELSSVPRDLYRQVLAPVTAAYDQTAAPRPSTMQELLESWHCTRTHLDKAQALLGVGRQQMEQVQQYLDHNELELALDGLEHLGVHASAPVEFWAELRSAAEEMRLADHYERICRQMRRTQA